MKSQEKRNYIKLNDTDNYFSLGNLFRIIKENSNCRNTFLQSELFYVIFETTNIADSTINNYLTGYRAINTNYIQIILNKKMQFENNANIFIPTILTITDLIENKVSDKKSNSKTILKIINSNTKLKDICYRLYNIAKNDIYVPQNFILELNQYLNNNDYYTFLTKSIFYTILEKKQPIFSDDYLYNSVNNIIQDTPISLNDVKDFINIQFQESMWASLRYIKELAKKGNTFACLQLAFYEFYGLITGYPRYLQSYNYYIIAANKNNPAATWAIGFMYYRGYIGEKSKSDFRKAFMYFYKAMKLGSNAAINSIGLMYLTGNVPHIKKNRETAIKLFNKAIEKNSIFALNNLGKIYEEDGKLKNAFELYLQSASSGECWAANKIGEFYRQGKYVEKNMKKAYEYYLLSDETTTFFMCPWSKYNLAKYFYLNGNIEANVEKDISKAINLFELASRELIEACEELIYIYYSKYINSNKTDLFSLTKVKQYIHDIELSPKYTDEIKNRIEGIMKNLYSNENKISFNE